MTRRCRELGPADVLSQYRRDRFVAPAEVDPIRLAEVRLGALRHLAPVFEPVELAPLAPLGTHSVFARVNQNNVVSTVRMSEVAADPTNQLALEAAARRHHRLRSDPRSREQVRLCAVERVVRAQVFDGPRAFAHFSLLGVVVSGRSLGGHQFEFGALVDTLSNLGGFIAEVTACRVQILLSDFDGSYHDVLVAVADQVTTDRVTCAFDGEREAGRGYYPNVCFKLLIDTGDEVVEVGDGGAVDWTSSLLQSRKERLLIGGVSLDRLLLVGRLGATEGG